MNFVEKMLGVREPAAEQPTPPPQEGDDPAEVTEPQQTTDNPAELSGEHKTYTEEEIAKLLEGKKQEWQEEQSAKNQDFLSSLPENERLKMEQLNKDEEISKLKAELSRRDLEKTVIETLDANRLPVSLAELVQYSDEKGTMESLEKLTSIFTDIVNDAIKIRVRGKTPAGLGSAIGRENSMADPFTQTFEQALKR